MPTRPISEIIRNQRIYTAPPDTTVVVAARGMKDLNVGAVMVVDQGHLVGIFTERDALFRVVAPGLDLHATTLAQVMTPDPMTIRADRPFGHALHLMNDNGFRHVPVVDNGRPVGMVSVRDALGSEVANFEAELRRREEITEIIG